MYHWWRMAAVTFILCSTVVAFLGGADAKHVTIRTNEGAVRGTTETVLGEEVNTFWGIPYAEPPVGSRRFKAPTAKGGWEGTLDALEKPLTCYQNDTPPAVMAELFTLNTKVSEDCLYLNVWAPSSKPVAPRAVMVFIYGGGFMAGTSTMDYYDGSILAAKYDVVVVSMQYRVGVFGFLYLGSEKAPGNMGLMDQQMAFQWVQKNIASFNGDPSKVTIFGESAGSASVHFHMLSPWSKDLFKYAILESGNAATIWANLPIEKATSQVANVIAGLECDPGTDDYSCLMSKDAKAVLSAAVGAGAQMSPIVDGDFVSRAIDDLLENGDFARSNVLIGTNRNEGSLFIPLVLPEISEQYPNLTSVSMESVQAFFGIFLQSGDPEVLEAVMRKYGVPATDATNEQLIKAMTDFGTDRLFLCSQVPAVKAFVKHNVVVYEYLWDEVTPEMAEWLGATHGADIFHVFGTPFQEHDGQNEVFSEEGQKRFSEVIMGYWTNFAKTGNPNLGGAKVPTEWLPHTGDKYQHIILRSPKPEMDNGYREGYHCEFLEEVLAPKPKEHEEL